MSGKPGSGGAEAASELAQAQLDTEEATLADGGEHARVQAAPEAAEGQAT